MAGPWLIPVAGAVAGAMIDKDKPMRGAMLGGIAGMTGGAALGAMGAGAAGGIGAGVGSAGAGGVMTSAPIWEGGAQIAAPIFSGGTGATATGGLLGSMGNLMGSPANMMLNGGKMILGAQQPQGQPQPVAQPPAAPYQARTGSMSSLGQGLPLLRPTPSRYG